MKKVKAIGLALGIMGMLLSGCSYYIYASSVKAPPVSKPVSDKQPSKSSNTSNPDKNPNYISEKPVDLQDLKRTAKELVFNGPRTKKVVALTFDDGPDRKYTAEILNILKKYHVHATFFVIGNLAKAHPDLIRRMVDEGHVVGSHTWDHPFLPKLSDARVRQEIERTSQIVKQITGKRMALLRPPYGAIKGKIHLVENMGYSIIEWDVDTLDWKKGRTPAQIFQVIKRETRPGSIILEHCGGGPRLATVKSLPKVIQYLKKKGYEFVTVDQMMNIAAYR